MERPLLLHSSALSEKEYTAFTAILNDLTSDDAAGPSSHRGRAVPLDVDAKHVSLGETKGWIRGKFGVESSVLDKVSLLLVVSLTRHLKSWHSASGIFSPV